MSVWILKSNVPFSILHGKSRMFHQKEDCRDDMDVNFNLPVWGKQMALRLMENRDFCTFGCLHTLTYLLVVKIVWIVLLFRDLFSAWSFTVYWVDGLSSARV